MFAGSRFAVSLGLIALAAGCGYVPKARFDALQAQNRTLTEQKRVNLSEIENLRVHTRGVEEQLAKVESEYARADRENAVARQNGGGLQISPVGMNGQIAELARQYPCLQYDPAAGMAKLDTDILFDSGQTDVKPAAQKLLNDFADIFQSPDTNGWKIMVVGHTDDAGIRGRNVRSQYPTNWHLSTARALSVAEALKKAGIPEDRMGVAGYGNHQPVTPGDSLAERQRNRRVELYVLGPETPLVGWKPPTNVSR
jgi:flagellar motor protein MotB